MSDETVVVLDLHVWVPYGPSNFTLTVHADVRSALDHAVSLGGAPKRDGDRLLARDALEYGLCPGETSILLEHGHAKLRSGKKP